MPNTIIGLPVAPQVVILGLSKADGYAGDTIVITGTGFYQVSGVDFNGGAAAFSVSNNQHISATVPANGNTGAIHITNPLGTFTGPVFTYDAQLPIITSLAEVNGLAGDTNIWTGQHLSAVTSVDYAGTSAAFTVINDTHISTTVPNGGTTGNVHAVNAAGTGVGPIFTYDPLPFSFNLAVSPPPAGIITSRSGGDVYAQNGASTVLKYIAGDGYVFEDLGDGYGGGLWAFGSHTNYAPDWINFTNSNWARNNVTVTANAHTDPFNTNAASNLQVLSAGLNNPAYVRSVGLGPTDTDTGVATVWTRDGSPVETAAGAFAARADGGESISLRTGTSWRRRATTYTKRTIGNQPNYISVYPTGASSPDVYSGNIVPTFDTNATGGGYFWGAQTLTAADEGTIPLVNSSTGAQTISVDSSALPRVLDTNTNLHIEVEAYVDGLFTEGSPAYNDPVNSPTLWSLQTADGYTYISRTGQTGLNFVVNDISKGGQNIGVLTVAVSRPTVLKTEVWNNQNGDGVGGMNCWINGHKEVANRLEFAAVPITTPLNFYLGSKAGTANFWANRYTSLKAVTKSTELAEGIMIGDSLTASFSPLTAVGMWIYNVTQARTRDGICCYAYPGQTVVQQTAKWLAAPQRGQSYVKWIFILCGVNDVNVSGASAATTTANLQTLITDINTQNPTAKIILAPVTPCKVGIGTTNWTTITTYNNNIAGTGPNPITGTNLIKMPYWNALDDGFKTSGTANGNLWSTVDNGDGLHENDIGRQIIGNALSAVLVANGLLS